MKRRQRAPCCPISNENFAREQGMPIVWTQSDHSAPFGGVMLKKFPTIREDKYLWKGQPSFELYEQMLQPKEGEYRVVNRHHSGDLAPPARSRGPC
jgi:nicotinamidase-related amidase